MYIESSISNRYVYQSYEELCEVICTLELKAECLRSELCLLIDKAPLSKRNYLIRLTGDWHGLWRMQYKDTLPIIARAIRQRINAYERWIVKLR